MAEPLNATFFALKRRDRAVLLPATLVFILVLALLVAAWLGLNWRAIIVMFEILRAFPAQPDEAQTLAMVTGMMGLFLWTMLLLIPLYIAVAAYEAACLRWMIRGEAPGLFGITLDYDVLRVYGVYWCWFVAHMAIGVVVSMLMFPFMMMMMGDVIAQGPEPDPAAMWNLQLKLQGISMLQYIPMIFIGVRFAPAAATSIARRRFSFFEAWKVTEDRFWALFGSFALIWLIAVAASVLIAAPTLLRAWPHFEALWRNPGDEAAMRAYFQAFLAPEHLIWMPVGYAAIVAIAIAVSLMSYGVNARAALAALEEGKIDEVPQDA